MNWILLARRDLAHGKSVYRRISFRFDGKQYCGLVFFFFFDFRGDQYGSGVKNSVFLFLFRAECIAYFTFVYCFLQITITISIITILSARVDSECYHFCRRPFIAPGVIFFFFYYFLTVITIIFYLLGAITIYCAARRKVILFENVESSVRFMSITIRVRGYIQR